jgi:hypothetical protein
MSDPRDKDLLQFLWSNRDRFCEKCQNALSDLLVLREADSSAYHQSLQAREEEERLRKDD